jgi:hypothetical protein
MHSYHRHHSAETGASPFTSILPLLHLLFSLNSRELKWVGPRRGGRRQRELKTEVFDSVWLLLHHRCGAEVGREGGREGGKGGEGGREGGREGKKGEGGMEPSVAKLLCGGLNSMADSVAQWLTVWLSQRVLL